jgi:predicted dehydrogenase
MKKIRWGVLGATKIAVNKVIPALQRSQFGEVVALASRDQAKGEAAAKQHGIARVHASYEALLADSGVDAVYIPLPNHLHVPWSLKALAAGKHLLCEKPIALDAREAAELADAAQRFPKLKIMEAFMYRFHPQWLRARAIVAAGGIGELRSMHSHFSYWNVDPTNVRNIASIGGGGMMDIGCYCVSFPRFIFGAEPRRVLGVADIDPDFGTDRVASGLLDFSGGATASFTCGTQLTPYQRAQIFGTSGRIEIEIPCNAPPDKPTRLWHQRNNQPAEEITFPVCDQYTLQGDAFARAVLDDTPVPTPLADAVGNMRVIESVLASAKASAWVVV